MKLFTEKQEYCVTEDGAKFYGCPLNPKEVTQLMNKATKKEWDKGQRFVDVEIYKFKIAKINKVIWRWEGVTDHKGMALECNDANREIVYLYNAEKIDKVLDKFDELSKVLDEDDARIEKNSENGLDG